MNVCMTLVWQKFLKDYYTVILFLDEDLILSAIPLFSLLFLTGPNFIVKHEFLEDEAASLCNLSTGTSVGQGEFIYF